MNTATKETFTPGPWQVCSDEITIMTGIEGVDYVHLQYGPSPVLRSDIRAELIANARLIAAAPELLKAAETFIAWVDDVWGSAAMNSRTEDGYKLAKAAIRKAKGEL